VIAFLVPHRDSKQPLYAFVVSVDALEKRTGIDFFPKLDDATENALEKKITKTGVSNYHSLTLLASIFRKINNRIVKPQSPEPPYERKATERQW
jgi:hypothetical protein